MEGPDGNPQKEGSFSKDFFPSVCVCVSVWIRCPVGERSSACLVFSAGWAHSGPGKSPPLPIHGRDPLPDDNTALGFWCWAPFCLALSVSSARQQLGSSFNPKIGGPKWVRNAMFFLQAGSKINNVKHTGGKQTSNEQLLTPKNLFKKKWRNSSKVSLPKLLSNSYRIYYLFPNSF